MSGNPHLRRDLQDATTALSPSQYREEMEVLRLKYGHTIDTLPGDPNLLRKSNCYAYALGVWDRAEYLAIAGRTGKSNLVNSAFVQRMIEDGAIVEIRPSEVQTGTLVIYFGVDQPRHAGIVVDLAGTLTLRSKWGGDEVHEHALWEVPANYGDCTRFFRQLPIFVTLSRLREG